jgi:hypothetical protein
MQPTDGLLIALQDATFSDPDIESMVKEVIAQLDSDLTEASYEPSSVAIVLFEKFDAKLEEYLKDETDKNEELSNKEDEDEDEDEDNNEDEEDEDDDNEEEDEWNWDEDEDNEG